MSTSAGYLAFPNFEAACLWHALYGRNLPSDNGLPAESRDPQDPGDEDNQDPQDQETPEDDDLGEDDDLNEEDWDDDWFDDEDVEEESDEEPETPAPGDDLNLTDPEPSDEPDPPRGFTMTTEAGQTTYHRDFASWYDFVTCVRDHAPVWPDKHQESREKGNRKWAGTASLDEAINLALTGWPDGRKLLSEVAALIPPKPQVVETWAFDVAGSHPSVPMYCAGDPACMMTDLTPDQRASKPIIRIDIGKDTSWTTDSKAIMLRGAAALSLANELERQGQSVELRIVGSSRSHGWKKTPKTFRWSVVFKPAGQPLDLDRAAFALAHPATLRRLGLALYEQHADLHADFHPGYGSPTFEPNDPNPSTIFIPAPSGRETPDSARTAVRLAYERTLTDHKEAA